MAGFSTYALFKSASDYSSLKDSISFCIDAPQNLTLACLEDISSNAQSVKDNQYLFKGNDSYIDQLVNIPSWYGTSTKQEIKTELLEIKNEFNSKTDYYYFGAALSVTAIAIIIGLVVHSYVVDKQISKKFKGKKTSE